jgi:hypothetical protein
LPNTWLETMCNNVGYTVNVATLLDGGCSKLVNNTAEESVGLSLRPVLGIRSWPILRVTAVTLLGEGFGGPSACIPWIILLVVI